MIKKSLKTLAKIAVIYTIAEFITMWRMQTKRIPLKKFTKTYFGAQIPAFRDAFNAGSRAASGMPGESVSDVMFKKYL